MTRDTILAEALMPLAEQKFKGDCTLLLAALNQNQEFKKAHASRRLDGAALITQMERLRTWLATTHGIRFVVRGPGISLSTREPNPSDKVVLVLTDECGNVRKMIGQIPHR